MSGNRVSPGSDGPNSAFRKLRLIWSAMSMTVPEPKLRRMPPAAFVRTSVSTPSRAKTRTGSAVSAGG